MDIQIDITNTTFETERLILRPWCESDLEDFYEYASVPGVGEMAGWRHHESRETSKKILDCFIVKKNVFAVVLRQNNKVIGSLGLHPSWANNDEKYSELTQKEIGYVLSKSYWGKGLMPEAVTRVIEFCFDTLKLDAVTIGHFQSNSQSRRVIEKCGFQFVKRSEYYAKQHDKSFEDMKYILPAHEWEGDDMIKPINEQHPIFSSAAYQNDIVPFNLIEVIKSSATLMVSDERSFVFSSMQFPGVPAWIWTAEDISKESVDELISWLVSNFQNETEICFVANGAIIMSKIESRCGLLCSECSFRESHNCGGCVETNGNPFHGECHVAKCCQDKGFMHCGECPDIPAPCGETDCKKKDENGFTSCDTCDKTTCGKLHAYSYTDPDHGDNPPGARVEQCKKWAKENT